MAEITMNKMKIRNLGKNICNFYHRQKTNFLNIQRLSIINKEIMNKSIEIRTKIINIQLTERNYK